jgi:hypothetical protein
MNHYSGVYLIESDSIAAIYSIRQPFGQRQVTVGSELTFGWNTATVSSNDKSRVRTLCFAYCMIRAYPDDRRVMGKSLNEIFSIFEENDETWSYIRSSGFASFFVQWFNEKFIYGERQQNKNKHSISFFFSIYLSVVFFFFCCMAGWKMSVSNVGQDNFLAFALFSANIVETLLLVDCGEATNSGSTSFFGRVHTRNTRKSKTEREQIYSHLQ